MIFYLYIFKLFKKIIMLKMNMDKDNKMSNDDILKECISSGKIMNMSITANYFGPLKDKIQLTNDEYDEYIIDNMYYYFRRGKYRYITSGPPAPRDGWYWVNIEGIHFLVVQNKI